MNARTPCTFERFCGPLDIESARSRQGCDTDPVKFSTHRAHGFKIAVGGDREPRLHDVDTERDEFLRHAKFLRHGHAAAGRLLTITQGCVEYVNSRAHRMWLPP